MKQPNVKRRSTGRRGPRAVGASLPTVLKPVLKKRGLAEGEIIGRWRAIVGDALAAHSCPERMTWAKSGTEGAQLRVRVASGFAPQFQHMEPRIVERINTYFGYRAVARLKLAQGALPAPEIRRRRPTRPLTAAESARIEAGVADIRDDALARALRALGARVLAAEPPQNG